jgi:flagellar FliL protein
MAKDAKPATNGTEPAPAKNSKKLLIIVSLLVLLLGLAGLGAYFLFAGSSAHDEGDDEVPVEKAKPARKKVNRDAPPIYVGLDAFTVNLVPEGGDQFLQVVISVEVSDQQVGEQIKVYTPKLRNDLTVLLSSKKASELMSKEGKEALAQEIRTQINEIIDPAGKGKSRDQPIQEVLFTSFIIQ